MIDQHYYKPMLTGHWSLALITNLPHRCPQFRPLASTVQIALKVQWVGSWGVISHATSNLILQRGKQLLKWPNLKCRLTNPGADKTLDKAPMGAPEDEPPSEGDTEQLKRQFPRKQRKTKRDDDDISDEAVVLDPEPLHAPGAGADAPARSSDGPTGLDGEYFWTQFMVAGNHQVPHQYPTLNYINQGVIVCGAQVEIGNMGQVDSTLRHYVSPTGTVKHDLVTDQDILDNSDLSRIPPRIAFRVDDARRETEKEIADLFI